MQQQFKSSPNFQPPGTNFTKAQTEQIVRVIKGYLDGRGFSARKLTDTPTDTNSMVPRGFVTANGAIADRPANPVTGQFYLAGTLPMWYSGTNWVNGVGSVIAS